MAIYLNDWSMGYLKKYQGDVKSRDALINDFEITKADLKPFKILLASYTYESYSGDAYVLLQRKENGQLFEVHGSHCSCYGLEGQWELEETTLKSIIHRLEKGCLGNKEYGYNEFAYELKRVIKRLEKT